MKKYLSLITLILTTHIYALNLEPEGYWDIQNISNPKVSPNGEKVLFTKRYIDKINDSFITEIWLMDADGENKRLFTDGSNVRWSPDGKKVAFTKADENDKSQLFLKFLGSDVETKITNSDKAIKDFAWSKNGTFIAYSAFNEYEDDWAVSYTHLLAHETNVDLVCRLLL